MDNRLIGWLLVIVLASTLWYVIWLLVSWTFFGSAR